jgi:hypothetical protein
MTINYLINLDNKNFRATHVYKIQRKDGDVFKPTDKVQITFDTTKLPKEMKFMFQKLDLEKVTPQPIKCMKCQILGHSKNRCDTPSRCHKCSAELMAGQEVTHNEICVETKCINCLIAKT